MLKQYLKNDGGTGILLPAGCLGVPQYRRLRRFECDHGAGLQSLHPGAKKDPAPHGPYRPR